MPRSARSPASPHRTTKRGCSTSRTTARRRTWSAWCGPGADATGWRRRAKTERRHLTRSVTTYVDDDGMVVLRARLTPELGAVVQRALEAAAERLYQESKDAAAPESIDEEVTSAQRRADALGLLAECALRGGPRPRNGGRPLSGGAARRGRRRRPTPATAGRDRARRRRRARFRGNVTAPVVRRVAWSSCARAPTARRWMSGARTRTIPTAIRRALDRPRCRLPLSRAARPAAATPTTLITGPMAVRRRSTT